MPFHRTSPNVFHRRWRSDGPRSAVLLLHGFSEHSGLYHRLAAELTRQGSDVWGLDQVGHGLSGEGDRMFGSVEDLAADADSLLDLVIAKAKGLPVFLLGHSLGGLTAIALAARRSADLAGVMLSGPPVCGVPKQLPVELIFSRDRDYLDEIEHDPLVVASPAAVENLWRAVDAFLPNIAPGEIHSPTLVIYGEHDVFTSPEQAERWTQRLPDGRLWIVAGGHHDVLQDRMHRAVAHELCAFIAAHRERT